MRSDTSWAKSVCRVVSAHVIRSSRVPAATGLGTAGFRCMAEAMAGHAAHRLGTRTFSMLDAAYAAGWAVLVKEAVANGRLTAAGGPPGPLTALAAARGVTEDATALAAVLAQPWASVVLSGAVTRAQLDENLAALTVGQLPALSPGEAPGAYWAKRRPGHGTELFPSRPPYEPWYACNCMFSRRPWSPRRGWR